MYPSITVKGPATRECLVVEQNIVPFWSKNKNIIFKGNVVETFSLPIKNNHLQESVHFYHLKFFYLAFVKNWHQGKDSTSRERT